MLQLVPLKAGSLASKFVLALAAGKSWSIIKYMFFGYDRCRHGLEDRLGLAELDILQRPLNHDVKPFLFVTRG